MSVVTSTGGFHGAPGIAKKSSGWLIATAVAFMLLGVLAIVEPGFAGLAITILVGWLLIFGGVAHFVGALSGGGARAAIWQLLTGFVYWGGGFYFLTHPLRGLGTLTLLLAAIILAEAVMGIITYFRMRRENGSGWLLLNALITLLLGGLIWFHWPSSLAWSIGTLVGVNLFITGLSWLMFGLETRKLVTSPEA